MSFSLHTALANDCIVVGESALSTVLLLPDPRFWWLILVPRIEGLSDFDDVPRQKRAQLMDEIERASMALRAEVKPDKINVAALGNLVPQLHIHVVARHVGDAAWPSPVWGLDPVDNLSAAEITNRVNALEPHLALQ